MDFEASSLSAESYPIEIAWSTLDGPIKSYLINPETVSSWLDWSAKSEKIHGIDKQHLNDQGLHPDQVVEELLPYLSKYQLYTDAARYDQFWLMRLLEASSLNYPIIEIQEMDHLIWGLLSNNHVQSFPGANLDRQEFITQYELMKQDARSKCPGAHRAAWDVQYLLELYQLAKEWGLSPISI